MYRVKNKHDRVIKILEGEKWIAPNAESFLTKKQYDIAKADVELIEKVQKATIESKIVEISGEPEDIEAVLEADSKEDLDLWLARVSKFDKKKRDKLVNKALETAARTGKVQFFHQIQTADTLMRLPQ